MELNVLKKDNNWVTHYDKVEEEAQELTQAILELILAPNGGNFKAIAIENIAEEALDVIQVAIGVLDKLIKQEKIDLDIEVEKHNKKLKARNWIFEKKIKIIIE